MYSADVQSEYSLQVLNLGANLLINNRCSQDLEHGERRLLLVLIFYITLLFFALSSTAARISSMNKNASWTDIHFVGVPSRKIFNLYISWMLVR